MHPLGGAVFPFPTPVLPLWCTVLSRTKRFRSRTPLHTWFDQRYGPKPDLTLFGWPPAAGVCPCSIRCARVECALARPAALRLLGPHNSLGCTRRSIQIGCRSIVHRSIDRFINPMCSESIDRSIVALIAYRTVDIRCASQSMRCDAMRCDVPARRSNMVSQ